MATETPIKELNIHYLTEEQYRNIPDNEIDADAIYMTPVDDIIKINAKNYGTQLPDSGVIGQVFFLLVND